MARQLGQILVDMGFINDAQLEMLVEEQSQQPGVKIGKVAEDMGLIIDTQLVQALAEQFDMQIVDLGDLKVNKDVLDEVTEAMAQMYRVIPLQLTGNTLVLATSSPENITVADELRTFLGRDIRLVICTEHEIEKMLEEFYDSERETIERIVADLADDIALKEQIDALSSGPIDLTSAESLADSVPVRKLLNMVLLLAIKDHASDIHFEPFEDEFRIRIKADGVLYEMVPPPRHLAFAITTRIKVMANLDIAERRLPQDGRIELVVGGHPVDLRVSVLPTMFGESVVMRVLDRSVVSLDLGNVGMDEDTINQFREVIEKPNGIVLVTGPRGSGKTTTLYSALSELNRIEEKLITTEDPVEYDIDGIIQVPINSEVGVTFASCLRAILRQDPDKILVGEIRDIETGEIAVQASLTGHLVFSTLHTNDAPSTITRMKDMGIPTFMISATVEAILAQRLVRRICNNCREETKPSDEIIAQLGFTADEVAGRAIYKGKGCDHCNNSGYRGRVGLFELMILNDHLREMIMQNASTDAMRDQARDYGMETLRDAGLRTMWDGITTAEEVIRETIVDG